MSFPSLQCLSSARWRRGFIAVWVGLGMLLPGRALAEPAVVLPVATLPVREISEYQVKAAYLVRFVRYVTWPDGAFAGADAPIEIGVLGRNPFDGALETMVKGLQSQGRPVRVRQLANVKEARLCHAVFIGRGQEREEAGWLAELRGHPVLTITDSLEGLARGAVLALYVEDTAKGPRVVFAASMPAARTAGLRLSASMLASARKVIRGNDGEEAADPS